MHYPDFETLLLEMDANGIATATLNRPKVLNALNSQVFDDLETLFNSLAKDPGVKVILLTGAGEKAFAAGADINELVNLGNMTGEQKSLRGQSIFHLIETCGKPVIALINGFALGGGCELALACHIRIASDRARLGQPEVKLGLIPGYGGTQRLPRLVSTSAALKLLLTGEIIDAGEALRIGLVNEVVPGDRLLTRGNELAQTIAAQAPLAISACMEAVRGGTLLPLNAALKLEADLFGQLCGTQDKKEGTRAFLEKRSPIWTNH